MAFEQHCIVELMGHQKIAGKVSEAAVFGTTLMRVDVPKTSRREGFTKFYGASAIYAITPVSEEVAQVMAESLDEKPVEEWRLRTVAPQLTAPLPPERFEDADLDPDEDDDDYDGSDDDFEDDEPDEDFEARHKREAAEWARELLNNPAGFVVLDTETTGLNRNRNDEACQIAVVDSIGDGKVLLDTLVKTSVPVDPEAAKVHGITDEMVKDAPTFAEILPKLKAALAGRTVVVYNATFDERILSNMLRAAGAAEFHELAFSVLGATDFYCAMQQYARFYGDWDDYHGSFRRQKLTVACGREGVGAGPELAPHSALGDALLTLGLVQKMAEFGAPKVEQTEKRETGEVAGLPF